jgi:hypothetical protein
MSKPAPMRQMQEIALVDVNWPVLRVAGGLHSVPTKLLLEVSEALERFFGVGC